MWSLSLFFLLFICHQTESALWIEANIKEIVGIKKCLHREHLALIERLFDITTLEANKREAIALDHLGRLLKGGASFCEAYAKMLENSRHYLKGKMLYNATEWQETWDHFERESTATREECGRLNRYLPEGYTGVFSPLVRCIDNAHRNAALSLIRHQFAEEEQGMR